MYSAADIEVWNVTPGSTVLCGAQEYFNVVGRLRDPDGVQGLWYRINGSPPRRVYFKRSPGERGRLARPGDFNIDTLDESDLRPDNLLVLTVEDRDGKSVDHSLPFRTARFPAPGTGYRLDLTGARSVEEVGQVIDGRWQISRDRSGEPRLQLTEEDSGYDRLVAFADAGWTTGFEVRARVRVDEWTALPYHNVGLIFRWNPHLQGDGHHLPTQWSTGLAYYAAQCPGLRLRFGVDVHHDEHGRKVGSHVLQERPFSLVRRPPGFLKNEVLKFGTRPLTQLRAGTAYWFRLVAEPERLSLTVWPDQKEEPRPQLDVANPPELLSRGTLGIIAANCAVSLYEYQITPLPLAPGDSSADPALGARDRVLIGSGGERST